MPTTRTALCLLTVLLVPGLVTFPMNTSAKFRISWLLLAAAFIAIVIVALSSPLTAHAQDAAPAALALDPASGITAENIIAWLTPILVPLIIAGMKYLAPKIPGWLLPILAPVLGIAIDALGSLATGQAGNVWMAALLGLAGVGLREAKDQLGKAKPALSPNS